LTGRGCGPRGFTHSRVFDLGISDDEWNDSELLLDAVAAIVREPGGRPLSIREGQFGVGEKTVKVFNVLFDTGALHKTVTW